MLGASTDTMATGIDKGAATGAMSNPLAGPYEGSLSEYTQLQQVRAAIEDKFERSYRDLLAKYLDKCHLYDRQVETANLWQEKARGLEQQLVGLKSQSAKSFVLAVIDGDGAYFREDLVSAGKDGGERAAQLLCSDIKAHVKVVHPDFDADLIMVHVFLHVDGLANAMAMSKVIPNPALLTAFGRGFCQGNPLFSFVDVGAGKEAADHKVKKTFELMMDNAQCRHIIFGGGHDNGYATYLRGFHNPTVVAKVSLLETTPIAAEFKKLRFPTVLFPGVFRTGPLPARPASSGGALVSRTLASHATTTTTNGTHAGGDNRSPAKSGRLSSDSGDDYDDAAFPALPLTAPSLSAAVSRGAQPSPPKPLIPGIYKPPRAAPSNSEDTSSSSTGIPDHLFICCNKDGQRLDRRVRPSPGPSAFNAFKDGLRKRTQKYCNQWHVRGYCVNGDGCSYTHGARLREPERSMLELVGRTVPCGKRSDCRGFACTWGHHCEKPGDCSFGDKACNFKRQHGMDYKPAYFEFADGRALFLEDAGFADQCKKFGF